ncbi:type II toxin-antitoxin system RelE/ParE family toxin [Acanthopleuribacter pedis]|uniref:Type II toxin-antitoxin system RelE/ParE family toxin n=1 Tax=Acanthopleuribacter pedis TaxID=442870 RepID=A0A8J7QP80_9BACT|nr:type II toxin-antitoxin system RelE/ParE family toxin [Acanthopleuribacter pedis]
MKVFYHPLAEEDIGNILDHYQPIFPALAKAFLKELDLTIAALSTQPFRYRFIQEPIRMCKLKRFPYAVLFRVEGDTIRILVVRHHRRHPSYGLDR